MWCLGLSPVVKLSAITFCTVFPAYSHQSVRYLEKNLPRICKSVTGYRLRVQNFLYFYYNIPLPKHTAQERPT